MSSRYSYVPRLNYRITIFYNDKQQTYAGSLGGRLNKDTADLLCDQFNAMSASLGLGLFAEVKEVEE